MKFKTPKRNSNKGSSIDIVTRLAVWHRKIEIKFLEPSRDFSLLYCLCTSSEACRSFAVYGLPPSMAKIPGIESEPSDLSPIAF